MQIDFKSKKATAAQSTALAFNQLMGGGEANDDTPGRIKQLPIAELKPYTEQPFKPYSQDKLQELADDIQLNGVLSPVIVRKIQDGYQILAGHNRTNAAKQAGLDTVPCIIKEADDKAAQLIMVSTNLCQREKLSHSEKAFAYDMLYKASGGNVNELVNSLSESRRQIYRYIRLTNLIPELLAFVDDDRIPLIGGYNLSFLDSEYQIVLDNFLFENNIKKLNLKQTEELKEIGKLTPEILEDYFFGDDTVKKSSSYKIQLSNSQISTILMCLRAQSYTIEPAALKKLMDIFQKYDIDEGEI